nr:pentatricopeptide repeat-containing protein At3g22670, mitochondrial-like [Arachis hypogaea]
MGKFGVKQDTAMLNALMDALMKGNSVEHAHDALLEFKGSVPLNSHSFNVLIHGWCKVRKFEWAKKAMEDMKEHGFHPDAFSYTTFVESYCREKDFRKVDRVMEEMRGNGCTPNAVTYTIVMLAQRSFGVVWKDEAGRIKDARDVFEDMPKQGVVRDVMTYNTMISIACTHQREETALRLLKEMEDSSCKPELETYHPLLKMCCRKKRMKVLRFLLDHMLRNDLSPEVGTYTLLVHGINSKGSHAEATAGRTRLQEHDQREATHRGFDGTDPTQQSRY